LLVKTLTAFVSVLFYIRIRVVCNIKKSP